MALAVLCASSAAAQGRNAAIRVSATVRDVANSDMIGAHALAATDPRAGSVVGVVSESGSWRITSGRSGQIGLQVETADAASGASPVSYVTICSDGDAEPADCRMRRAPLLEVSADGALPDFVVRVGRGPLAPVRLTVAFIAF